MSQSVNHLAQLLGKYFLLALLGCYTLAMLFPAPAVWLSEYRFSVGNFEGSLQVLLLSLALFVSAYAASIRNPIPSANSTQAIPPTARFRIRNLRSQASLVAGYLFGRSALLGLGLLYLWLQPSSSLALGLVFVLVMPVAVSSVPWTCRLKGNVRLVLGLLIISTLLTPFAWLICQPVIESSLEQMPVLDGPADSNLDTSQALEHSWRELSTRLPLAQWLWFIPPILAGFLLGRHPYFQKLGKQTHSLRTISTLIILLLNFGNAGRLADFIDSPELYWLVALSLGQAIVIGLLAILLGRVVSRMLREPAENQVAFEFATGMFNTGMAMVIVATAFPSRPEVLVPIMVFTLAQHLVAASGGRLLSYFQRGEVKSLRVTSAIEKPNRIHSV